MDRYEIENILKAELEDYEELYELSKNYIKENEKDLRERFSYAKCMEKPVKENQILFWNGSQCSFDGIPKTVFWNFYRQFRETCTYVWVKKELDEKWEDLPSDVCCVKKNSQEYWEAMAVSGCLICDGNLPVPFVKREEQLYFNVYRKPEKTGIDALSLYEKELDKADFLFMNASDEENIREENNEAGKISARKKILFLTNGKEEREYRLFVKAMTEAADREKYDITVVTPRLMSPALEAEFEELPENVRKFIYRGRLTVTEKDFILLRILEKHPGLYVQNQKIQRYVNGLMEREWKRIWGEKAFDCVVAAGQLNVQQFYMAAALNCGKKILVNLHFLPFLKERAPEEWKSVCSVFDRVYETTDPEIREILKKTEGNISGEIVEWNGKKYGVADTWACDDHRTARKLVLRV